MADIFYEYGGKAYANLTNKCNMSCEFCIRKNGASVGSAESLWLTDGDPDMDQILKELDAFHLENYEELTFCGYGEPTFAIDNLVKTAEIVKERYGIQTRINTNGLGDIINQKPIIPMIESCIDTVSISLNASDAEKYNALCHPQVDSAYEAMLKFASDCIGHIPNIVMTIVDIVGEEEIQACRKVTEELGISYRVRNYTA